MASLFAWQLLFELAAPLVLGGKQPRPPRPCRVPEVPELEVAVVG